MGSTVIARTGFSRSLSGPAWPGWSATAWRLFQLQPPCPPNQPEPTLPQPQGYHQDPGQRNDSARYVEPAPNAYTPPSPPYEQEPHLGFNDSGRDDLFARDPAASYGQNQYHSQGGANYQGDTYDQNRGKQSLTPRTGAKIIFSARRLPLPMTTSATSRPEMPRKHRRRGFSCRMRNPKTNARLRPIGATKLRLRRLRNLRRMRIRLKIITTITTKINGPTNTL